MGSCLLLRSWMREGSLRKRVLIICSNKMLILWCSAVECSPVVAADSNGNGSRFKGASSLCGVVWRQGGQPPEVSCANFCGHLELALPRLEGRALPHRGRWSSKTGFERGKQE